MFSRPSSHVRSPAGDIGPVLDQRNGNWRHWNGNGVPRKGIEPSQTSSKRSEEAPSELKGAARKRHVTPQLARDIGPVLAQRLQAQRPVSVVRWIRLGMVRRSAADRLRVPAILDPLESRSGPRY